MPIIPDFVNKTEKITGKSSKSVEYFYKRI